MNIHRSARTTFASRVLLAERVRKQGWTVEETASAFGISDTTVRKWLARLDELGNAGLRDRTSKPHRQPTKTKPTWEAQMLELRATRMTIQRISHSPGLPESCGLERLRTRWFRTCRHPMRRPSNSGSA